MHSKTIPSTEKKRIGNREETYQPPHVVELTNSSFNYVVSAAQITWSNYVVGGENRASFLPPQVLYCNSSSSVCQGPFKIKIRTQNLIRSKQRKGECGSNH